MKFEPGAAEWDSGAAASKGSSARLCDLPHNRSNG